MLGMKKIREILRAQLQLRQEKTPSLCASSASRPKMEKSLNFVKE